MAQNPGMDLYLLMKDIHLPAAVGYWPPAPGWWLLLFVTLLLMAALFRCWHFWQARRLRRLALKRLQELTALPESELAAALSRLLRQAVISHFPAEYAGLSGEAWLAFLDRPFSDAPFSRGVGRCLLDAPYRPGSLNDGKALIALCQRWLKKLPPQKKHQRRGR